MSDTIKVADLSAVELRAKAILGQLKLKYPALDGYLVYSSRIGQTNLGQKTRQMLAEFPEMFIGSAGKTRSLKLMADLKQLEREKKDTAQVTDQLARALNELEIDSTVQIEIRFGQLNYDLVWQLQVDDLVDQTLTDRSKSSIRIVLGTIGRI